VEIGLILKIAGIGLVVSITAQILNKSGRDEQGLMVIIAGLILVFFLLVGEIEDLFDRIKDVFELE
jgi:stage III sporulation protein AC